jgi:hypothetical protein
MEAICSSATSVNFQRTTRHYIPEARTLQNHHWEKLKSYINYCCSTLQSNYTIEKKLRGLSPQANYTDRATAAVGEVVPTFADRGVLRGQRSGSPRPLISVF